MAHALWTAKAKAALTRERADLELVPTMFFVRADWIDPQWIDAVDEARPRIVRVRWVDLVKADPSVLARSDETVDFADIAYSLVDAHGADGVAPLLRWGLDVPAPKVFGALSIVRDSRAVAEFFVTCVGRVQDERITRAQEFRPIALQWLREHPDLARAAAAKVAKSEAARARTLEADDGDDEEIARSKSAARWAKNARF